MKEQIREEIASLYSVAWIPTHVAINRIIVEGKKSGWLTVATPEILGIFEEGWAEFINIIPERMYKFSYAIRSIVRIQDYLFPEPTISYRTASAARKEPLNMCQFFWR
jgi:hypothetical protein